MTAVIRITELQLPLAEKSVENTPEEIRAAILKRLGIDASSLIDFSVFKRSYDARKKHEGIRFVYIVDVTARDETSILRRHVNDRHIRPAPDTRYQPPLRAPIHLQERPVVVGFGPCGLFTALILAQQGYRPIVLERGKDVRRRTQDTWGLWRKSVLTPESNVQFGEGGAGLFSDGKLYSQIKDPRFLGRKVMQEFVRAGAPPEILYVSKPHIGTFRLTGVVSTMREEIIALGGEVRFESKVSDITVDDGQVRGVTLESGEFIAAKQVGHPALGAADYKLVHHASNGRSVYSFCMCPGGTVVAATSETGRVVTNGMSQYSRNERNANAGIVVGIDPEQDYPGGPLSGVELQEKWESTAFELGGRNYCAPGQLVGDFIRDVPSKELGAIEPSYKPGVTLGDLNLALPSYAIDAIREALPAFGRQIAGFDRDDAVLTGIESRTSSPLRITRDARSLQSLNVRGLYPCGEGAGYAGGILSAGVDGIKVAEAVISEMTT